MRITVLLFGPERDAAGRASVEVELASGATVGDLVARLRSDFPPLIPHLPHARIAINASFAQQSEPIPVGAEVALIGLVSGG